MFLILKTILNFRLGTANANMIVCIPAAPQIMNDSHINIAVAGPPQ